MKKTFMTEPEKPEKIDRSAAGLRDMLFDCIEKVRAGTMEISEAQTIVKLSGTIIASANTQLEFERLRLGSEIPGTLGEMKLVPAIPVK